MTVKRTTAEIREAVALARELRDEGKSWRVVAQILGFPERAIREHTLAAAPPLEADEPRILAPRVCAALLCDARATSGEWCAHHASKAHVAARRAA